MALQAPDYRPDARGVGAPPGYQPQRQTQRNNGGPIGLGQPAKSLKTAINPARKAAPGAPPAPPQFGQGDPRALYPEVPDEDNVDRLLWADRNSMAPAELIQKAFTSFLQREADPMEVQSLLTQSPTVDHLVQQLLSLKPAPPAPMRSAILG